MKENRNSRFFFTGFIICILLCSTLGRLTLSSPQFPEIKRFWTMQSPGTNFFPTVRQEYEWAKNQTNKEKTTVVFGGSSFLLGNGQPVNQSTAVQLQNILGPSYAVVNLSAAGSGTFGRGLYVTSKLIKDGYKVVFVSDINPGFAPPFENFTPYDYSFWQAKYANYLNGSNNLQGEKIELNYKSIVNLINQYLYFQELANFISYNYLKINNSPVAGGPNLQPLKMSLDTEYSIPYEERHKNPTTERLLTEQARSLADRFFITQKDFDKVAKEFRFGLDQAGSPRSILVACESNPRYTSSLSESLILNYYSIIDRQVGSMNSLGIEAHSACRDFVDQDYGDIIHLAPSGASKLALKLSEWILSEER